MDSENVSSETPELSVAATRNRACRIAIEERRARVQSLMLHGWTPQQMIEDLAASGYRNLTRKTIENDMAAIARAWRRTRVRINVEEEVGRTLATYDELAREAWENLDAAKKLKDRLGALRVLRRIEEGRWNFLANLGALERAPQAGEEEVETWEIMVTRLRSLRGLPVD